VGEKRQKTALTHALHTQLRRERRIQEQHKSEAAASNIGGARRWIGGTAYGSYQQDSYKVSSLPPNPTCRAMLPLFNAFSCVFAPPCMMTCECAAALGKSSLPHLHDTVDIASPVPFASKTHHEDESSLHPCTHRCTHTHTHTCTYVLFWEHHEAHHIYEFASRRYCASVEGGMFGFERRVLATVESHLTSECKSFHFFWMISATRSGPICQR
jgi:hypothetical protein